MLKKLAFLVFSVSMAAFAQDLYIPDNPYDLADDYTKSKNSFKRERWFYEQRMYPFNYIPEDVYNRAIEQKK